MREQVSQSKKATTSFSIPTLKQPTRGFGLELLDTAPQATTEVESVNPILTHDIRRISLRPQAKLSISQPGDFYEQQADSVAQQVMRRMAQPVNRQSVQRQQAPDPEDLQMKSVDNFHTSWLQRQQAPEEEEIPEDTEVQRSSMVQRRPSTGGIAATDDLETSIQQSRGGGQPLADDIKQPMEQAFGADFSSVNIHTDDNSDKLNKSIQARAFTTGQDIFFRQGEYSPGSNAGKELLAHELTHVVQQNGSTVQPKSFPNQAIKNNKVQAKALLTSPSSEQPIQHQDIPQQQPEQDNQGALEQAALKPDTQNQEEQGQGQAQADQGVVADTPPADEGGSANPPPAEGGSPSLGADKAGLESNSVNQQVIPISAEDPGQILEQLKNTPPTQACATYTQAETAAAQALENQRQELQATIPEIPAPTGLSPQMVDAAPNKSTPATAKSTEQASAEQPANPVANTLSKFSPGGGLFSAIAKHSVGIAAVKSSQGQDGDQVNTNAGERPKVNLTGEADPSQMDGEQGQSLQQVQATKGQAANSISQDFGENNIFPKASNETLKANKELSKIAPPNSQSGEIPPISGEIVGGLNQGLTPYYQSKIAPEQEKYLKGKQKFDVDSYKTREDSNQQINSVNQEAKQKQLEQQKQTQQEVAQARQDWHSELDNTEKDYQDKAGKATKEQRQKINDEKAKGEKEADQKITEAEQEAADKKKQAEEDAAKEKEKEKGERKSGWDKFWGGVKDIGSAIVEGIKKAVNAIYDGLRKVVKAIFDAVKTVVTAIIDAVRTVIVGLIKAFGEILKGLVQIVFAAFPEISKKFTDKIDQAINKATEIVNAVADFLQKAVSSVLDFLAKTLDTLLGLVQSLYNGALTVIGMLIRGEFAELAKRFSNLIEGAKAMPSQFETAGLEELMGGDVDLDKPLAPAELAQAQASGVNIPGAEGEGTSQTAPGGEQLGPPWTEENVGVDAVEENMELSPELTAEVMQQTQGEGEIMLAESQDESRSMEAIMSEATGQQQVGGELEQQEIFDDGLSPKERAGIKWGLMKEGIKQWFSDNWPKLLAGLIAAAAVIIAAIVASGGAVLSALPMIMNILTVVFAADTIAKIGGYLRDYLSKSWEGDIQGGGKSLAKALAAGAIELIMLLTFEAGKVAAKGAKAVAKGAKAVAKGTAKVVTKAFRGVIKGIKYVIDKGKVLFKGIAGTGVGKQFKRLKDLGKGLLDRMRFKAFRIRATNGWFRLEGLVNPWVLIAEGNITKVAEGTEGAIKVSDDQLKIIEKLSPDARQALSKLKQEQVDQLVKLLNKDSSNADDLLKQYFYKAKKGKAELPDDVASKLEESLDNFNIVKDRGYPYGFEKIEDFQSFKNELNSALGRYDIPTGDIRIHGSAVHKTTPGDLDVAIIVNDKQFKELGERFIANSNQEKVAKSIAKELEQGKIPSYRFRPGEGKTIVTSVYGKAGKLEKIQVSLIRQGSSFDIGPYFPLSR